VAAPAPDPAQLAALADALAAEGIALPPVACQLLAARGHGTRDAAVRFLRPQRSHVEPAGAMADADRAVERLVAAIRGGEVILVHGDYDVDGMTSTALLTRVLRSLGARTVVPWVPARADGYDLGPAGCAAARRHGATLVVTCDCGTSAAGAIADLVASGIDVIVTDHHLPGGALPAALAVCNPRRPDCPSVDKDLAAVGIAYKLAVALCEAMGADANLAHQHLDLVALGTIADVAPLRGENRVFAQVGLRIMQDAVAAKAGIRALIRSSGMEGKALTAGRVSFTLAPRLNAAGRVGDAKQGLALLLADADDEAHAMARELEELNQARQGLDREVLEAALRQLDTPEQRDRHAFVLSGTGWHHGVIGIAAARIVEHTARPAVMVTVDDAGIGKGSGRSIPRFDLHAALTSCAGHFLRFGGHRAAAGLTMEAARLPAFAEQFDDVARAWLRPEDLVPELRIDAELPLDAVDESLERLLRRFEPFGVGNPAPLLCATGVAVAAPPRRIGSDGVRFAVEAGGSTLEAIGWGLAARAGELDPAHPVDLLFRLERDDYRGLSRMQLKVADMRR
jgi:single-stranded-DNA-specific exonuclease